MRNKAENQPEMQDNKLILLVPGERLELSRPCGRWILSPLRLPFRHPGAGLIVIIKHFPLPGKASHDRCLTWTHEDAGCNQRGWPQPGRQAT